MLGSMYLFGSCFSPAICPGVGLQGHMIGLSLVLIHIVCIPVTGTSVNPARSIAPAIFEGGNALSQLWLFIIAPFLGAIFAAGVWKYFECQKCK